MATAEYNRLHAEHERLKGIYREAFNLLVEVGPMATRAELLALRIAAEDARFDLEVTSRKLEVAERDEKDFLPAGIWFQIESPRQ